MAIRDFYSDVDLKANQLFNSRLHNVTTAARITLGLGLTIADKGYQVYDTDLSSPYYWDGTAWVTIIVIPSVTSVTASLPLASSGGFTPNLSISQATTTTDGYLSSIDWTTFNNKENAITAGTILEYFRGDKTFQTLNTSVVPELTNLYYTEARVDANINVAANTAARHNAVTIGTANGLSLSTQVLSLGLASSSVNGALSSTDWTTFNGKFTLPSFTSGSVLFSNGTTIAQDNANFFWDDANNRLGIGNAIPAYTLDVTGTIKGSADALINGLTVGRGGGNFPSNTALGASALFLNSTGVSNVAVGGTSMLFNTTGEQNTSVGYISLASNTQGSYNTAVGFWAMRDNTLGNFNTSLGISSGRSTTTGSNNITIGYLSGNGITTGSQNTIIGRASGLSSSLSNTIIIADGAGNYRFYSPSTGNILFGSTIDSGHKLQVTGTAIISSTTTLTSLSGVGSRMVVADATGVLSTTAIPSFTITASAIGGAPNAEGITISGTNLTLEPADENFGGVVTTGNQNFKGKKYFWNSIYVVDSGGLPTVSIAHTGITFENSALGAGTINATNLAGITLYELPTNSGTFALSVNGNFADNAGEISLTAASVGAEPALGNPSTSGYVLSSTTAGVRSWVAAANANIYTADGTLTGNRTVTGSGYNLTLNPKTFFDNGLTFNASVGNVGTFINTHAYSTISSQLYFYPDSGTNVAQTLNIIPKGTGFNPVFKAQFSVYNNDIIANGFTNAEFVTFRAAGSLFTFASGAFGTGIIRPLMFSAGYATDSSTNINQLYLSTAGNVLINSATDAGYKLDVNGTVRATATSTAGVLELNQLGIGHSALLINRVNTINAMASIQFQDLKSGANIRSFSFGIGRSSDPQWANGDLIFGYYAGSGGWEQSAKIFNANGNWAIGNGTGTADIPSAKLQVNSTTQGFLPPRMTTTERNAIATPATGLQIYNTTTNANNYYDGSAWVAVAVGGGGITSINTLTGALQTIVAGTSGTDFAVSSTGTTHTLNLPTASALNRGALSSADWTTFDGKQPALNGTGFVKISGTTISYDNSSYYLSSNPSNFIPLTALSSTATGLTYTNTTGVFSLTAGHLIPTTISYNNTNWDTAYTNRITSLTTTGSGAATLVANVLNIPTPPSATFTSLTVTGDSGASTLLAGVLNVPTYTLSGLGGQPLATNLTSLAALSYSSTSFVKMTAAGTFALDTNTYYLSSNPSSFIALTGLSAGTGISYNNTTGVITNSSPDQTVTITAGSGISVSGTYPSFTVSSTITQYTDALARAAISLTVSGSSGASTYNNTTGVLNVPTYTLSGLGGVATTRSITINGTTQDLSADRTFNVGTVTSVAALTLGTTGTDVSSSVATGTTTPVITLNIPTASAVNRGVLSTTDWSAFSAKQGAITLTTTGTSGAATLVGTTLNIPQYSGGSISLAAIGSTPNANAATLTGTVLNLEPASASFGGIVTTGTQTFVGAKTFSGSFLTITGVGFPTSGLKVKSTNVAGGAYARFEDANGGYFDFGKNASGSQNAYFYTPNSVPLDFYTANTIRFTVGATGVITLSNLAGVGSRMVTADASGNLATAAIPSTTIGASAADILSASAGEITADDAGSDKIVFWDDSANKLTYLTVGSNLTITDTTISASGTTTNALTFSSAGTGDVPTSTFNGSAAKTISFNSVGANKVITSGTAAPSGGVDGDIYLQYV